MSRQRKVAILLFDEVEVLDFAGPFEIFSVTGMRDGSDPFEVYTVAEEARPVLARNRLSVNPTYSYADCPPPDIVLVPGGYGSRVQMEHTPTLDWVRGVSASAELVLSVCTGALILARAGLLGGLEATTHHLALDLLEESTPEVTVRRDRRVVDNGRIILSAGVAAGMDMSFHVVARLHGEQVARETAAYIEYPWSPAAAATA